MVDEVQKQKQKPKRIRGKNLKNLDLLKQNSNKRKIIERIIEEVKNEEIKPDLSEGPAKVTFDPSDKKSMENFMKRARLTESAKGGMINKYAKGGAVKKNKSNMITTKGWGASRKT